MNGQHDDDDDDEFMMIRKVYDDTSFNSQENILMMQLCRFIYLLKN